MVEVELIVIFVFFQRQYEFLWLYETHRDYFDKALNFEKPDYSWIKGCPLSSFLDENFRDKVFNKRVRKLELVLSGKSKTSVDSEISRTSCGLICGK